MQFNGETLSRMDGSFCLLSSRPVWAANDNGKSSWFKAVARTWSSRGEGQSPTSSLLNTQPGGSLILWSD